MKHEALLRRGRRDRRRLLREMSKVLEAKLPDDISEVQRARPPASAFNEPGTRPRSRRPWQSW